ncbi:ferredoxin [Aeromicrobium alkaliterrae]|uniref:Ferredoxin n=1 Tax=Aeromicrobium alkaliterrae TaxID=302168 RepID=A0ABN2JE79_9ACTN
MKICVDMNKCTGLGICESVAPDYFEVGDDGELRVLREEIALEDVSDLEESVTSCPTEALWIEP